MSAPSSSSFRGFLFALLGIFLFTWIGLVVLPWTELGHLAPIPEEGTTNIAPWDAPGLAHQGEHIYAVNGCAYCHTQEVRPLSSGADLTRGWGTGHDDDGHAITRRTYPRDYIWQGQVFTGYSRAGADLTNVGDRFTAAQLYHWLYDSSNLAPRSSMPQYRFLFETRRIPGTGPSQDALVFSDDQGPAAGYEVVPTADGRALVAYLLSLNKGYHLPDEHGPVAPPKKADQ